MTLDRDLVREWGILLVGDMRLEAGVGGFPSREHMRYTGWLTRAGHRVCRVSRADGATALLWTDERARVAFGYQANVWLRIARESGIGLEDSEKTPFLADMLAYWAWRGELS